MFRSVRIKNWKLTLFSITCFLILLAVCLLMLRAAPADTVEVKEEEIGVTIRSDEDVEAFIAKCGHAVEGCVSDDEITVPKMWNDTYAAYNDLQKKQGFDLRRYKDRSARKLVYALKDSDQTVTILICDDRIIAADICAPQQGSEPQPLIP